jgi:hypothetical protein
MLQWGSLVLSSAFDVVDIDLLITRLTTLGLPSDWMSLLESWLRDRVAFVEVSVDRSMLYSSVSQPRFRGTLGFRGRAPRVPRNLRKYLMSNVYCSLCNITRNLCDKSYSITYFVVRNLKTLLILMSQSS